MENEELRMEKEERDWSFLAGAETLSPFSILHFLFFVPWCLGGLIPLRVLA